MSINTPVGAEDVMPVRSRISWAPIIAGSVVALSLYFLLTLLGAALGFSISDKTSTQGLAIGAAVYAITMTAICLFIGGLVASQLSVGENKLEGALYGVLVWAVVFAMLMWLMASGVKAGFNAMVGVATAGSAVGNTTAQLNAPQSINVAQPDVNWEESARRAGFTQQQIDEVKKTRDNATAQVKATVEDPALKQKAEEAARQAGESATTVSWLTFAGTLIAMLAAVAGGRFGAGPTFQLFAVTPAPSTTRRVRVELP
jgi:hypothetical protein